MTYEHILVDEKDGVAVITLNRPQVLNALSVQTVTELIHAVDVIRDGKTARVLLFAATGRAFCSGADLSGAVGSATQNDKGASLESAYNPLIQRLRHLPIPVIAALNGPVVGGGLGIALSADFAIAAQNAYFLAPFANIGLVPDVGATWLLPRLIGKARATAMMMLGERVPAEDALEWGMIHKVVPQDELLSTAEALAQRFAHGPTAVYALIRNGIYASLEQSLGDTLTMERRHQLLAGRTVDHAEGIRAFREKRAPRFQGL